MGKKRAAFAALVAVAAFAATMAIPRSAVAAERGVAHEREGERGEEAEEGRLVEVERRDEIQRSAFQAALRFDRGAGTSRFAQAAAAARHTTRRMQVPPYGMVRGGAGGDAGKRSRPSGTCSRPMLTI